MERPSATARRQLTVAMRRTPGRSELPGTTAEAATTAETVLAALTDNTWAHFACHARADLTAPSEGGLCPHDGTLAVSRVSRLELEQAELAYLSACSTAYRGVFADEPSTVAAAFELAGFRHVIASLWPLNDGIAATTARSFYREFPDALNP